MADPADTHAAYETAAEGYDRTRSRAFFEGRWIARFADMLPGGGTVLDLGCGTGEPIAGWFLREGFRLTGLDFSEAMLGIARARFPGGDWRQGDMRRLDLPERFDGIIGWDSFFHLTPDEQRGCLPRLARHLVPGGILMVTVGPEAGEVAGQVDGRPVYHASLSPAEYASLLEAARMRLVAFMAEDPHCDFHTVLMARKAAA
jgi:SAM-dependent methyltransferase